MRPRVLMVIAGLVALGLAPAAAGAQTITVSSTTDDAGSGSCPAAPCSLRQAFQTAQNGDVIQLAGTPSAPVTYTLTLGGSLQSYYNVTLQGGGADASVIDGSGNQQYRILRVGNGILTVHGVGFAYGSDGHDENCSPTPCSTLAEYGGGDIYNAATLALDDVGFSGEAFNPVGGGLSNSGTAALHDVTFTQTSAAFGGGIFNRGTLTVDRAAFDRDGDGGYGGGGFYNASGTATLSNSTIYGSGWASSRAGGVLVAGGHATLRHDTLAGNLRGALETDGGVTTVGNTIIASGFDDGGDYDCIRAGVNGSHAPVTEDLGGNVDQDDACGLGAASDQGGVDPLLGPLAGNGGLVETMALGAGSPALDRALAAGCVATDARSVARPQGAGCDVGAFELAVAPPGAGGGDGGAGGGGMQTTTTTTASSTPQTTTTSTAARTVVTPPPPLPLQCAGKAIMLLDVHRTAGRVVVSGLTLAAYAGRTVTLSGGRHAGSATVAADGTFTARLSAPTGRGTTDYRATVAGVTSAGVALAQPKIAAATGHARHGRVTLTLRVAGAARGATVTITQLLSCSARKVYKKVTVGEDGTAKVAVPAPASGFAFYRASAAVGHAKLSSPLILVHA